MGALTGFIAGVAVVVGVTSLLRYAENRLGGGERKDASPAKDQTIEFEQDPSSGAYRLREQDSDSRR